MKKIPTLFKRVYENHKVVDIFPEVTQGMEWVLEGKGEATVKFDGACCAVINGEFYKRYDAKGGKPVPEGAIKCQEEADPVTGHLPCWVKVSEDKPEDKWFNEAYYQTSMWTCQGSKLPDGTYEAIGKHFQSNPYNLEYDFLVMHGKLNLCIERTFDGIKECLKREKIEGIVFWLDGEPRCKIKRSDFGFEWPIKKIE